MSISKLGNLDGDKSGYNGIALVLFALAARVFINHSFGTDFAVGAPFADGGKGAVYVFLGQESKKEFRSTPAQVSFSIFCMLLGHFLLNSSIELFIMTH